VTLNAFIYLYSIVTMTASIGKRNVTVWRPSVHLSVYPISIITLTRQGAACDEASVHFRPTIRRTDILVGICVSVVITVSFSV